MEVWGGRDSMRLQMEIQKNSILSASPPKCVLELYASHDEHPISLHKRKRSSQSSGFYSSEAFSIF